MVNQEHPNGDVIPDLAPIVGDGVAGVNSTDLAIPGNDPAFAAALAANPEFQSMWSRIEERAEHQVASSTEKNYRRMADTFDRWRAVYGFQPSVDALALYIEGLFRQGRRPSYLDNVRASVAWLYPEIRALLKGNASFDAFMKSLRRENKTLTRQAAPIRHHDFVIILRSRGISRRDKAMIGFMRDGMLRGQEARNATYADVVVKPEDGSATFYIRRSKTDQLGEGAFVWISPTPYLCCRPPGWTW